MASPAHWGLVHIEKIKHKMMSFILSASSECWLQIFRSWRACCWNRELSPTKFISSWRISVNVQKTWLVKNSIFTLLTKGWKNRLKSVINWFFSWSINERWPAASLLKGQAVTKSCDTDVGRMSCFFDHLVCSSTPLLVPTFSESISVCVCLYVNLYSSSFTSCWAFS